MVNLHFASYMSRILKVYRVVIQPNVRVQNIQYRVFMAAALRNRSHGLGYILCIAALGPSKRNSDDRPKARGKMEAYILTNM